MGLGLGLGQTILGLGLGLCCYQTFSGHVPLQHFDR